MILGKYSNEQTNLTILSPRISNAVICAQQVQPDGQLQQDLRQTNITYRLEALPIRYKVGLLTTLVKMFPGIHPLQANIRFAH
jgi:hypothetical protein